VVPYLDKADNCVLYMGFRAKI